MKRRVRTLPLRLRLVAGFSVAITVVLLAAGSFVYWRVSVGLDAQLDRDADADVRALLPRAAQGQALPTGADGPLSQVLDLRGRVLSAAPALGLKPLVPESAVREALAGPVERDLGNVLLRNAHPLRVRVVRIGTGEPATFLLVAVRRDKRDETLRELLAQLAVAGLGALVISAVVGERLAKAALRPVERYRQQAESIAHGASGIRLEVPPDRDDEVTRLGDTLNTMLGALERTVDRERRFTQDASHELRTPLTLLSTRVQLALRGSRTVEELHAALAELGTDIKALSRLAEDLLSLTAAQNGAARQLSLIAFEEVVEDVTAAIDGVLLGPMEATSRWSHAVVLLGRQQLRQILTNLLGNALLHGAAPVTVSVSSTASYPPYIEMVVHDEGTSLPPEFVPQAVERFARGPNASDLPGAGLGLPLVHALVAAAQGELRLCAGNVHHRYTEQVEGPCTHLTTGTSVTVLLPVRTAGDEHV